MKNIDLKVNGSKLTITIDLAQDFGSSSSGKSVIVASTEGAARVPGHDEMRINCTVFKYPPKS